MKPSLQVALIYFAFGFLWILLSDIFINALFPETGLRALAQTFKGWFYVVLTTALLYGLVRYFFHQIERKEREKRNVFQSTMRAVHHILNNFLSNMLLFKLEAEAVDGFDKAVIEECDAVIFKTAEHLKALGAIEQIDPGTIEASMIDEQPRE